MYVLEPTPRKSWLRHSSPTARLLGKFPFGRLNYKYSGGLASVQRSVLTRLKQWNRRPRPHYPQQPQPHRLLPARRRRGDPDREILGVNPWSPAKGVPRRCTAEGLGLWLGSGPTAAAPGLLEELLRVGTTAEARKLLAGFLDGQRRRCLRDGGTALAGSLRLGRWLLRHRRRLQRRRRQRLLTRLLKRLPQHWRRRRRALGALLEHWWRLLEERTPRGGRKRPAG